MPSVKVINATKRFGRITAAEHVTLSINDGEYVTILGPSGCGKTTLLRLIAGLIEPDEGDIYIGDRLVNKIPPEDRNIGYVFQNIALFPHMKVLENVVYGPFVRGEDLRKAMRLAKETLELAHVSPRIDAYPRELSGGVAQTVAVARALTTGSKLLLLDEPLGALDARVRVWLRHELRRLVKSLGLTAIHVTHNQEEALSISDRVVVMRAGRIEQIGSPIELYWKPESIFVANFIGEANFMEGRVLGLGEHGSAIEIRGGLVIHSFCKAYDKDVKVVAAVRPEAISIRRGEVKEFNSLFGLVEDVRLIDGFLRYKVRLDNEDMVIVKELKPYAKHKFKLGDRVTIGFRLDKVSVYRYPEGGLRSELEME